LRDPRRQNSTHTSRSKNKGKERAQNINRGVSSQKEVESISGTRPDPNSQGENGKEFLGREEEAEDSNDRESNQLTLSEAELKKMKRASLVIIAKRRGAAYSGKREKIIQNILNSTRISDKDLEKAMNGLSSAPQKTPPTHHLYYRDTFNPIDEQDRYWNIAQGHNRLSSWKAKMAMSLLQIGLVNALVMRKSVKRVTMVEFMQELAKEIAQKGFKF